MEGSDQFCDVGDGVTLCYRVLGDPDGEPIVLIAGLSLDLTSWPDGFVRGLTAAGLRVVVVDGREIGRSTRQPGPMPPRRRWLLGRATPVGFDLRDLAADLVVLLDRLGIPRAHLLGTSLGGMIGQVLAATRPDKVATLVSMYSNTGAPGVGQPDPSSRRLLAHRRPRTAAEFADQYLTMMRHIGSPVHPIDEAVERAWAQGLWQRAEGRVGAGVVRQVNAMLRTGDRTALLRRITAPTLVIHGDHDLMVDPSGGTATAAAISGARLVTIEGLRHHIAPGLTPRLVGLVVEHVRAHPIGVAGQAVGLGAGRVAAVTGAGSGIGRALAYELAKRGARLSVSDVDEAGLAETAERLAALGAQVLATRVDVTDRAAVAAYAQATVERFGVVHEIYNNAGIAGAPRSVLEADYAELERVIDVDLWGVIHGSKEFLPHLVASGAGRIVNLSSLNGLFAQPGLAGYCTAKFAVRGFTETLRGELVRDRMPVRVTVVHPGGVRTQIALSALARAQASERPLDEAAAARVRRYDRRLLRMDPVRAATIILDGVAAGRGRVLVGGDARAFDALVRLAPSGAPRLAARLERALGPGRRARG